MFDSHYPYHQVDKKVTISSGYEVVTFTFAFTSGSGRRYLIVVEEYPNQVCAIKFYPKAIAESPRKYNKLTGWECTAEHNYYSKIISTCLVVMVKFYMEDSSRSFLFIGAPTENEDSINTRRFALYRRIMPLRFSDVHFRHLIRVEQSIYLLLNRKRQTDTILGEVEEMVKAIYPDKE